MKSSFVTRTETFGLDTQKPWALSALLLLFHVPRAYKPLVIAWDERHPGTIKALDKLTKMGFVEYQSAVVIDTRSGENALKCSRAVARYRTTSKGKRLVASMSEDIRVLEDLFPHLKSSNVKKVAKFLKAFDLEDSHAKYGLSVGHATEISGLPERNGRWWCEKLLGLGLIRELPDRYADVREVVPAHWRVTRMLCKQLSDVLEAFSGMVDPTLKTEFRLKRSRFLTDIDPARLGISGATDFDHDVECQNVLGALLKSPRLAADGIFTVEPRLNLPLNITTAPWTFDNKASNRLFYQPDAEIREKDTNGIRRSIVEYERYQTRRDAWNHIERFLGYLHTMTLPFEAAILRFVVDSESRLRSYKDLIEAYCDYALDNQDKLPANSVILAVSSVPRILAATDPLDPRVWYRIPLPAIKNEGSETVCKPILHDKDDSPYEDYFGR